MLVTGLLTLQTIFVGAASVGAIIHVPADYSSIQEAINAAQPFDTIVVSPGTYLENIHFIGKTITLTGTALDDPGVVAATVIRSANGSGQTVRFLGSETSQTKLIGVTITGATNNTGNEIAAAGGGLGCNEASPTVSRCVVSGNTALYGAGLAYCHGLIEDCTIEGNAAAIGGGLLNCFGTVRNCRILGNRASRPEGGAGAYINGYGGVFENCVIAGNISSGQGGGMAGGSSLRNCTIVGNSASTGGGVIVSSPGQIVNCILWDNLPNQFEVYPGSAQPTFSCVQSYNGNGGGGGVGSISSNPMFVDAGSWGSGQWIQGDYRLRPSSPCIDVGDNAAVTFGQDLDGRPRIMNGSVDMGAYEFDVQAIPTLSGSSLFVLMALLVTAGVVIVTKRRTSPP